MRLWRAALLGLAVVVGAARAESVDGPPAIGPLPRYQKVNETVRLHELSPVAYFRVLLGMTPAQRERALTDKPGADRQAILRKIAEYEALPADVREARLKHTEARWQLIDLMKTPADQRAERLRLLDPLEKPGVEERLRQWDQLPLAERKAYLQKQDFMTLYLRWQSASSVGQNEILDKLTPAERGPWLAELNRWQALPEDKRREMSAQFRRFFELDDRQKLEVISPLSEAERREMEKSLRLFAQLPTARRRQCVQSFSKFASLSDDERNQFLRNAARWEEMTPEERQVWRQMVVRLPMQPPIPPGFYAVPAGGPPPMPPGFDTRSGPPSPPSVYAQSKTN